jgi:hypothetical protein
MTIDVRPGCSLYSPCRRRTIGGSEDLPIGRIRRTSGDRAISPDGGEAVGSGRGDRCSRWMFEWRQLVQDAHVSRLTRETGINRGAARGEQVASILRDCGLHRAVFACWEVVHGGRPRSVAWSERILDRRRQTRNARRGADFPRLSALFLHRVTPNCPSVCEQNERGSGIRCGLSSLGCRLFHIRNKRHTRDRFRDSPPLRRGPICRSTRSQHGARWVRLAA